jgi:hypothetical protein
LEHEIDDLKQVCDDMSAKLVEYNEKSANLEKVVAMSQNCDIFYVCHENNYFKAKLDGFYIDVSPLKFLHNDMSGKDYDFSRVVIGDLAKLRNVHARVASQLESTICELDELKARPSLLCGCLQCPKLKLELNVHSLNVKNLETELLVKSHVLVTSHPCEVCVSLKGKLVHATNENTMLIQDVYLTLRIERTKLSEKMIEEDLSRVDEYVTHSIHKLGLGYERCEDKGETSALKFIPSSNYHKEKETIEPTKAHYSSNPKPSFNPMRGVKKETPMPREEAFVYIFCARASHMDEFCFHRKRIEKRCFEYTRNSFHDKFFNFPPRSYSHASPRTSSRALSRFSHGPNHHSYGFGS